MKRKMNSGYDIPTIGLGTWTLTERNMTLKALEAAYQVGYRHFDTAWAYHNEKIIGEFIRQKPREELFITTKLWCTDHDRVADACAESMSKLGVDYLDLYLIHWPVNTVSEFNLEKVWTDMEKLVEEKKVRSIGVANFGVKNLTKVLSFCKVKPSVNQLELHPYLPQVEVRKFCRDNGIIVISYSSLGSSGQEINIKRDPIILKIAERHGTTSETILLSYVVALGCCIIPRSSNPKHIASNFKIIKLSDEDMNDISEIKTRHRFIHHKAMGPHCFD